jgi:hypothetical protein
VKAISLWQPWASLIAIGAKRIETRSWSANYVGPLAIHAAKRWTGEMYRLCLTEPFQSALIPHFETPEALPLGCIVATCRLIGCAPVRDRPYSPIFEDSAEIDIIEIPPDGREREFGDYTPGRFAWVLTDIVRLRAPVAVTGRQGFFEWDPSAHFVPVAGVNAPPIAAGGAQ